MCADKGEVREGREGQPLPPPPVGDKASGTSSDKVQMATPWRDQQNHIPAHGRPSVYSSQEGTSCWF